MKRKYIFVFVIIFLFIVLVSCNFGHIEDTNGPEDFTIESFTEEDIVKKTSYTAVGFISNKIGSKSSLDVSKFTGVYQFDYVEVQNKKLTFKIDSNCTKGNFRIVIVKGDEIIKEIAINSSDEYVIENANGFYEVKFAGESAKFSIDCTIIK